MITTAQAKSSGPNSGTACLVSWKEIAAYFKREVRTLQRWEKTEGLPVRRHYHSKLATVYAYSSELDQWRLSRETQFDPLDSRWRHATSARPKSSLPSLKAAPDAYISYLKGRYCWAWRTTERFNKAIDYFEQAIEQDPKCALAHAGLADTYNSLWFFGGSGIQGNVAKARQAALKAIELDEGLAEAHASLAYTLMFDWDWGGAEREFRKAIQLNPACGTARHWYADFLAAVGRHQEALDEIRQAQEAEPLSLNINSDVGGIFYLARNYEQAIEHCQKTLEIDPDHWVTHWILGNAYWQAAMPKDAIQALQTALSLSERNAIALASLARCYLLGHRKREARKLVEELEHLAKKKRVSPYTLAVVHSVSKQNDEALHCLQRAYREKVSWMVMLKVDPQLDNVRADPRFQDLLRRVGLAG